jgi:type I restriction enzyme S subunit
MIKESTMEKTGLPVGWELKKLGEVCITTQGVQIPKSKQQSVPSSGLRRYLYISDFKTEKNLKYVEDIYPKKNVTDNDLIVVNTGNSSGDVFRGIDGILSNNLFKVSFDKTQISTDYIYNFLTTEAFISFQDEIKRGTANPHMGHKNFSLTPIPIPPLPQQKQIVVTLEKAFAAIDTAKANAEQNLQNAKELFESYLQNIFENKGDDWEEKTISEIVENGILSKPLDGNHGETHPVKSDFKESGVPFVMSKDLAEGLVNQKTCHFISREQADLLRKGFSVDGDVLLTHKGTIGRVAILKTDLDYVMLTPQVTYYRVLNKEVLYNRYLFYYLKSPIFQKPMNEIAGIGSTRAYIGITKQRELKIRFPNNLNLQKEIAERLDALSLEIKKLEAIYAQKVEDLDEMKKSVLQKAFSGELNTIN